MMEIGNAWIEEVLMTLRECSGVIAVKILSEEEKKEILNAESKAEEKIVFGMCKSLNKGVREAVRREFAVAMVIQTSDFQYPHHPYMIMVCGDQVLGELVEDRKKIEELRKNLITSFCGRTFVVYMKKIPRNREEREKIRLIYLPRKPVQLRGIPYIRDSVFGTPSTPCDMLIKKMLAIQSQDITIGTCLIGFNIHE